MNMSSLNKWLTLTANVGVIAGIIFLVVEIQQNNELLSSQARENLITARDSYLQKIVTNEGGIAELVYKAKTEKLTGIEIFRINVHWGIVVTNWASIYQEVMSGALPESYLPIQLWTTTVSSNPSLVNYWNGSKEALEPDFVKLIDSLNIVSTNMAKSID